MHWNIRSKRASHPVLMCHIVLSQHMASPDAALAHTCLASKKRVRASSLHLTSTQSLWPGSLPCATHAHQQGRRIGKASNREQMRCCAGETPHPEGTRVGCAAPWAGACAQTRESAKPMKLPSMQGKAGMR